MKTLNLLQSTAKGLRKTGGYFAESNHQNKHMRKNGVGDVLEKKQVLSADSSKKEQAEDKATLGRGWLKNLRITYESHTIYRCIAVCRLHRCCAAPMFWKYRTGVGNVTDGLKAGKKQIKSIKNK